VTGEWRKLHNEEINNLYRHPMFSGDQNEKNEMRWACSTYGERRGLCRFWWGNLMERNCLGNLSVDERIILRWIFRKWDEEAWTETI